MTDLARPVQLLWVLTVFVQIVLLGLIFLKGHFRRLPFFTAYIASNICQAGLLLTVYIHSGFYSSAAFWVGWGTEAITLVARSLAITEIFCLVLKPYRGIWALGWRLLAVASGMVLVYAVVDAGGSVRLAIPKADRGVMLAFAVALLGLLLLVRYYFIYIHPVYKALLGGFCFYSCVAALISTLLEGVFVSQSAYYESIWNSATLLSYFGVLVVWTVALRSPLPTVEEEPSLLPDAVYNEVTPLVHARLRLLNDRLTEMLHN